MSHLILVPKFNLGTRMIMLPGYLGANTGIPIIGQTK